MRKIVFVVVLVMFFLVMRAFISQYDLIEKAKRVENPVSAVKYYERALLFYVPFSPFNKEAIEGILDRCKTLKESEHKLYCYETLRSSLYQIRNFYIPYKYEIKTLNPLIAELKTEEMIKWKYNSLSEKDRQSIYNYHMEILKYDGSPSMLWSLVSVFSLCGWIVSLIFIIFKGLTTPINKKNLFAGLAGYFIFFGLWLLGLWMA